MSNLISINEEICLRNLQEALSDNYLIEPLEEGSRVDVIITNKTTGKRTYAELKTRKIPFDKYPTAVINAAKVDYQQKECDNGYIILFYPLSAVMAWITSEEAATCQQTTRKVLKTECNPSKGYIYQTQYEIPINILNKRTVHGMVMPITPSTQNSKI